SYVPWSNIEGGFLANNWYSGLTIGPDGSAYAGVFGGLVAWRPLSSTSFRSGQSGATSSALTGDLFAVNTVHAGGLAGLMPAAGARGLSVLAAGGPTRTAPVDAAAFSEAFIDRDGSAAVDGSGDIRAEQVLGALPPAVDFDFAAFRQVDSAFASDTSFWLSQ